MPSSFVPTLLCLALAIGGCTHVRTTPPPDIATVSDPLEPVNRVTYRANGLLDAAIIDSAATLYRTVLPRQVRGSLVNVLDTAAAPFFVLNEALQGDAEDASHAAQRFYYNATFGLFGLFDVADAKGIPDPREDFGQTLAVWGVGPGPYLVLPLFGPSTTRGAVGRVGDIFLDPLLLAELDPAAAQGIGMVGLLDRRGRADTTLDNIARSADPYTALRSLYLQRRLAEIYEDSDPYADLPDF